jgi:transmembrane sensor
MNKESVQNLLIDYVSNQIDADGYKKLMDLVAASAEDAELQGFMERVWNSRDMEQPFSKLQSEILYKRIITDQRFKQDQSVVLSMPVKPVTVYKFWKIASAAVILITMAASLYFYLGSNEQFSGGERSARQIPPGRNNAILTLSNGNRISLADAGNGKVAEQAGMSITKTADGKLIYAIDHAGENTGSANRNSPQPYNTIETPLGGQYQIKLPDGTMVWLNAASSLRFPAYFVPGEKRTVVLTGEAYFEVAHLKKQPFIVKTDRQDVTVLGTHFNINTYLNEPFVKTTLVEGRVSVSANSQTIILQPGQESVLDAANQMKVNAADLESVLAWKNGKFVYNNEDLYSIMRKVERWYNVQVVYKGDFTGRVFNGSISRFNTVAEVLRKFELTNNLHFKIEGRRITVMP